MLHANDAKKGAIFGVSLTTGYTLPDIEDVPSENTSLLELLCCFYVPKRQRASQFLIQEHKLKTIHPLKQYMRCS
jgi:hypothetical protein